MSSDERVLQGLLACHSLLRVNHEAPTHEISKVTLLLIHAAQNLLVSHLSRKLSRGIVIYVSISLLQHKNLLHHRRLLFVDAWIQAL